MPTRAHSFDASTPDRPSGSGRSCDVLGADQSWFRRVAAPTGPPQVANTVGHQAALAYRLTDRDRWLIHMIFEHRVLHAGQVSALAFPSANSARQRLRELHHWSLLDRFRPRAGQGSAAQHYVLGPAGAAVLAAEHGVEPTRLGYRGDRAMRIAHSPRLAHTVGRNGWFLSLATRAGSGRPGEVLSVWWSEERCARFFGDVVRPDGYGRWHDPAAGELEFFLEYDRGTETTDTVARKLDGYARLAAATGIATPVLVWLPSTGREPQVRTSLARARASLEQPEAVPVATAAATLLDPDNPAACPADEVWLPMTTTSRASRRGPCRLALAQLRTAWPHLPELTPARAASTWPPDPAERGMLPDPHPMPPAASTPGYTEGGTRG